MVIRVHYNRFGTQKGLPWTVHTSKFCAAASHVSFEVPTQTEECPKKKTNPRYFIKCFGRVSWKGKTAVIVPEK